MPRAVESSWPEQQHDMCNIILDATEYNTFNHYANYESNNHGDQPIPLPPIHNLGFQVIKRSFKVILLNFVPDIGPITLFLFLNYF